MDLDLKLAMLQAEKKGYIQGRKDEQVIWEQKLKDEKEKAKNPPKWVTQKEAYQITGLKSHNGLMDWVRKGYINPPVKRGKNYWERADLLKMRIDGE